MKTKVTKENILYKPVGNNLYAKILNWCRRKIATTSSVVDKCVCIFIIALFSEVVILLNNPVPKSVRLNPDYAFTYYSTSKNSANGFNLKDLKLKEKISLIARPLQNNPISTPIIQLAIAKIRHSYIDIPRVSSIKLIYDDRVIPDIFEKLSPVMSCGPPQGGKRTFSSLLLFLKQELSSLNLGNYIYTIANLENSAYKCYTLYRNIQIGKVAIYQLIKANSGQPEGAKLPVLPGQRGCQRGKSITMDSFHGYFLHALKFAFYH